MDIFFLKLFSYFPTKLPVGMTSFNEFANDIAVLTGPIADIDSMRFAIASILIHSDSKYGSLSKNYFVQRLRKSAANQVASQVFQDIKKSQADAQKPLDQSTADTSAKEAVDVTKVL